MSMHNGTSLHFNGVVAYSQTNTRQGHGRCYRPPKLCDNKAVLQLLDQAEQGLLQRIPCTQCQRLTYKDEGEVCASCVRLNRLLEYYRQQPVRTGMVNGYGWHICEQCGQAAGWTTRICQTCRGGIWAEPDDQRPAVNERGSLLGRCAQCGHWEYLGYRSGTVCAGCYQREHRANGGTKAHKGVCATCGKYKVLSRSGGTQCGYCYKNSRSKVGVCAICGRQRRLTRDAGTCCEGCAKRRKRKQDGK